MLRCRHTCCAVLYTCHPVSHVYKDQFDGNAPNFVLFFTFNFFSSVFLILPIFYKDRFDSKCNNLGTDLIAIFINLGIDLIYFFAWSKYKWNNYDEVWHEMTNYFN